MHSPPHRRALPENRAELIRVVLNAIEMPTYSVGRLSGLGFASVFLAVFSYTCLVHSAPYCPETKQKRVYYMKTCSSCKGLRILELVTAPAASILYSCGTYRALESPLDAKVVLRILLRMEIPSAQSLLGSMPHPLLLCAFPPCFLDTAQWSILCLCLGWT